MKTAFAAEFIKVKTDAGCGPSKKFASINVFHCVFNKIFLHKQFV